MRRMHNNDDRDFRELLLLEKCIIDAIDCSVHFPQESAVMYGMRLTKRVYGIMR